jgi:hypothetical protein
MTATKTVSLWSNPPAVRGRNPNHNTRRIFTTVRVQHLARRYNGADRPGSELGRKPRRIGVKARQAWVHIALVHSDGILRAYKNGVEVGSVASGATLQPVIVRTLYVGGIIKDANNNWSFEGSVDEVQLWNVARSAAEIQQDRNSVLVGDEPGLAAYYRMSDGAGLILTDDSIHDWNGALLDGFRDVPPNGAPPQWVQSNAFPA